MKGKESVLCRVFHGEVHYGVRGPVVGLQNFLEPTGPSYPAYDHRQPVTLDEFTDGD